MILTEVLDIVKRLYLIPGDQGIRGYWLTDPYDAVLEYMGYIVDDEYSVSGVTDKKDGRGKG
jgi:hypothetical protein